MAVGRRQSVRSAPTTVAALPVADASGVSGRGGPPVHFVRAGKNDLDKRSAPSYILNVKVGDAIKLIEADGWTLKRTRGSHRQYTHPTKPGKVTISGKPSADLHPKTERSIRRQAGL
jgi:predicted RNA binding protein YcfA (HicA-like mRNA interferase family)